MPMPDDYALRQRVGAALHTSFRSSLLSKGLARGLIRRSGELPEGSPNYSPYLDYDLRMFGYSLLSHGLRMQDSDDTEARLAFERAGSALEALTRSAEESPERDFDRLMAACAYHVGGYSARAYSLLSDPSTRLNLTTSESALSLLIVRKVDDLNDLIEAYTDSAFSDSEVEAALSSEFDDGPETNLVSLATSELELSFLGSLSTAVTAVRFGDEALMQESLDRLRDGLGLAAELSLVASWWTHRMALHLLGGLWRDSLQQNLPITLEPDAAEARRWRRMRRTFLAELASRTPVELDLWPSQIDATRRALRSDGSLVVSLPTSAGKTRVAEIAILRTLAQGKRVVFVTPLRALSAQSEAALSRTFNPLGISVTSLYGSIGATASDEEAIGLEDIVVSTPEKLDFALRSSPELIDDVGLVVLDEGHMIGPGEREVRYEAQIQRLLRRPDASNRRIVCLSAVLPSGNELDDFVSWLTDDDSQGLVENSWRPTRLRFGEVVWRGTAGRLAIDVDGQESFVPRFVSETRATVGRRRLPFPSSQNELVLATAWQLLENQDTVLVYCPQRRSVRTLARTIVKLNDSGLLPDVSRDEYPSESIARAIAVGREWYPADDPLIRCLQLGVAVHHGGLPSPFRREVERLLREKAVRMIVSSPTLAQGLNLSASSLVFSGVRSGRDLMSTPDFRNVVGRAGRAFVDVEGLVLYPMFDSVRNRRRDWSTLINDETGRRMESGLVLVVVQLLGAMRTRLGTTDDHVLLEYVVNSGWVNVATSSELEDQQVLASLDSAIVSLLGSGDMGISELGEALDTALSSSLWARRLLRLESDSRNLLDATVKARARHIWSHTSPTQRRALYLAGLGLEAGLALEARSAELADKLADAELALEESRDRDAVEAIAAFANIVWDLDPFRLKERRPDWASILETWLLGNDLVPGEQDSGLGEFIEGAIVYKLTWAIEAIRVFGDTSESVPPSRVSAALEVGSLRSAVPLLIRTGLTSRRTAVAVAESAPALATMRDLAEWLRTSEALHLGDDVFGPGELTDAWNAYLAQRRRTSQRRWRQVSTTRQPSWTSTTTPAVGTRLRVGHGRGGGSIVRLHDGSEVGRLDDDLPDHTLRLLEVLMGEDGLITLTYLGPEPRPWAVEPAV